MVADNQKLLTVTALVRAFVNAPKGSTFASEMGRIMKLYIERTLKKDKNISTQIVYDFSLFSKLIPYSSLSAELVDKFIKLPH